MAGRSVGQIILGGHGTQDKPKRNDSSSTGCSISMILNATLKSDGKATTIPIPVGNGDHSFKWFALAASEHLTLQSSTILRRQNLVEPKELVSKTHLRARDIYTKTTSFFHPEALIKDHLVDGDDITVELYSSSTSPHDEHHRPSLSIWSCICFGIGDASADERDRLIKEKTAQLERERQRREQLELERRIDWERPRLECMTSILEEQLVASQDMEQAARKEWALIVSSGKIDNIVKGEEEKAGCCEILVQNYQSLCELYKDFSVVNAGGGTIVANDSSQQTLEFIEFSKLIFDCKISLSSAVVQKIFLESSIRGRGRGGTSSNMGKGGKAAAAGIEVELCRHEFLLSLVKLSSYMFIALRRREQSMLRRRGHSKAISHATTPSPSEALQMLYDENLWPVLEAMPVSRVKHALASKEAMLLFHEHLETLTQVFSSYAKVTNESRATRAYTTCGASDRAATFTGTDLPPPGTMMSGTNFLSFARDANFLQSNESGGGDDRSALGECSPLDVRKAFAASRNDDGGGDEGIVFPEFIEAVARLGIMAFHSQSSESPCSGDDKLIACVRRAVLENCNSLRK